MGEDTIVLSADNCSFTIPRNILAEHSVYFAAALESGMLECATGHFVFPEITSSQLTLFVQCAKSGFAHWPEDECEQSTLMSDKVQCDAVLSSLTEVLGLASLADYLQISLLTDTCATRLSKLLSLMSDSCVTSSHEEHQSHMFRKFLLLWATFRKRLTPALNDILFRYAARNPVSFLTSFPNPPDDPIRSDLIDLVVSVLTSDMLCVSDEDEVLDIALSWIRLLTPSGDWDSDMTIVRSFLNCVRLGLLSPLGASDVAQFWSASFPEFKWQDQLGYDTFASVLRSDLSTGLFARKLNYAPEVAPLCCCPRASTPCLLTLISNSKGTGFDLWAFNLLTGDHRTFDLTGHLLNRLSHFSLGTYDADVHVYLCHTSIAMSNSSVVFLIYDPCQHGSLSGLVWCLSTGKVQWLPRLPVCSDDGSTFDVLNSVYNSSSRRFGLVTLHTGLLVYFLAPVHSWVLIFAFIFDFVSWTWHTLPPTTVIWYPVGASVRFTPVEQLSSISIDGWVYAHVEIDERSAARALPISRHNLHQTSLLRSVFCRFRPSECTERSTYRFEVEILPPAPFLVRIYRLLALSAADRHYLFAFGTCCRDEQATQLCLDVEGRRWIRWSTWKHSIDEKATHCLSMVDTPNSELMTNLSPELLGFRGLVCSAARLPGGWLDTPVHVSDNHVCPSLVSSSVGAGDGYSTHVKQGNTDLITPTLVLIGRPDYHFGGNGRSASGIWFHEPAIVTKMQSSIPTFRPHEPAIPLPSHLTQKFYDSASSSAVIYANWENVIGHSSELFRFPTVLPENTSACEEHRRRRRSRRPTHISSSSNFSCLRYPWNWSSTDSD